MRLIDLLHKYSFEEIALYISKYDGGKNSLAPYKVHYDILSGLTPVADKTSESKAIISYYEEDDAGESNDQQLLDAYPLEGAPWEEVVGYELEITDCVNAPEAEIAACCLWHTSFFGFTQAQRQEFLNRIGATKHGDSDTKKTIDFYRPFIPSRKELLRNPIIHHELRTEMNRHRHFKPSKADKESKFFYQKRTWRTWKRYEINRMYKKRINDISTLLNILPEPLEKARFMFRVSHYLIASYQTNIDDTTKRFDYFHELIEKYGAFQKMPYSNCIVCVSCNDAFPVSLEEKGLYSLITNHLTGKRDVVYNNDDSLGKNIRIDLFNYD